MDFIIDHESSPPQSSTKIISNVVSRRSSVETTLRCSSCNVAWERYTGITSDRAYTKITPLQYLTYLKDFGICVEVLQRAKNLPQRESVRCPSEPPLFIFVACLISLRVPPGTKGWVTLGVSPANNSDHMSARVLQDGKRTWGSRIIRRLRAAMFVSEQVDLDVAMRLHPYELQQNSGRRNSTKGGKSRLFEAPNYPFDCWAVDTIHQSRANFVVIMRTE